LIIAQSPTKQLQPRLCCVFRFRIAIHERTPFALLSEDIFEFAIVHGIDAYAVVPAKAPSANVLAINWLYTQQIRSKCSPFSRDLRAVGQISKIA
jgi:hypothetical protein